MPGPNPPEERPYSSSTPPPGPPEWGAPLGPCSGGWTGTPGQTRPTPAMSEASGPAAAGSQEEAGEVESHRLRIESRDDFVRVLTAGVPPG